MNMKHLSSLQVILYLISFVIYPYVSVAFSVRFIFISILWMLIETVLSLLLVKLYIEEVELNLNYPE